MGKHPYEIAIIKEEVIPKLGAISRFNFLMELKNQLQEGQALQAMVTAEERAGLTEAWRRLNKGKTRSIKQKDGNYSVYLWLVD